MKAKTGHRYKATQWKPIPCKCKEDKKLRNKGRTFPVIQVIQTSYSPFLGLAYLIVPCKLFLRRRQGMHWQ